MARNTMNTYERRQTTTRLNKITKTATNKATGKKTTTSGTLKPTTASNFKSNTGKGLGGTGTPSKPPSYTASSKNRGGNSGSTKMSTSRNTMKKY